MKLIGVKVRHKDLGFGEIVDVRGDFFITVEFLSKTKKVFPIQAFETFLQAIDDHIQEFVLSIIQKAKRIQLVKNQLKDVERKAEGIIKGLEEALRFNKELETLIAYGEEAKKQLEKVIQRAEEFAVEMQEEIIFAEKVKPRLDEKIRQALIAMFGTGYGVVHLARNPIYTYQDVENDFGIRISGFGRGINPTASAVVLISSIKKDSGQYVYHDKWTSEGEYVYSGEGKVGNQNMTKGNLAIKNASRDRKEIHLFVKFSPQEYYYQGVFVLVGYTYEDDRDENGNIRKEYKFRLKKVE